MTNFLPVTGDVELDLAHRAAALAAKAGFFAVGQRRNLWTSQEMSADGQIGGVGTFVELTVGRNPGSNDSVQREFDLQLLHRFKPSPGATRTAEKEARSKMQALYEALHRSGEFVGADSKARYVEILALDVPVFLADRHVSLNVTLYRDG